MTQQTVAEIVTFRLKDNCHADAFVAAAHAMTPFLRSTGAMISRTLSCDDAGLWTEHIIWSSSAAAKDAAAAMFEQPEAQPFIEMIAQEDMSMRHAAIALYLPPE